MKYYDANIYDCFPDFIKKFGYNAEGITLIFKKIGEAAKKNDFKAYIIGGFVRDLLIHCIRNIEKDNIKYSKILDIDLSIEGDATAFASIIKNEIDDSQFSITHIKLHKRFKTAQIIFSVNSEHLKIDLASARVESYPSAGVLPEVSFCDLKSDVIRRDFTINTIGLNLDPEHFLTIEDCCGGLQDIYDKKIRILHNSSFIDDPTRIFRAVRFEKRLGFRIEKNTKKLLMKSVSDGFINNVSGKRIFTELKLIFKEKKPEIYFERLEISGILKGIDNNLKFNAENKRVFSSIMHHNIKLFKRFDINIIYMTEILFGLQTSIIHNILKRLNIDENIENRVLLIHSSIKSILELKESMSLLKIKKSEIYLSLKSYDLYALIFFIVKFIPKDSTDKLFKNIILDYINKISLISPSINGHDIKLLGIAEGPLYKEILDKIRLLKIDGKLKTKKEELLYIKNNYL